MYRSCLRLVVAGQLLLQTALLKAGLLDNWTLQAPPADGPRASALYGVASSIERVVAVGAWGSICVSEDAQNWRWIESPTTAGLLSVAFGNGRFVAVGSSLTILTSTDGLAWVEPDLSVEPWWDWSCGSSKLQSVTYGNQLWVAVGQAGRVLTSADGLHWTPRTSGTTHNLIGVGYTGSGFAAVGEKVCLSSADGITWTPRLEGQFMNNQSFAAGQGAFVDRNSSYFLTSIDGDGWCGTSFPDSSRTVYQLGSGGGRFFALSSQQVFSSGDGWDWTPCFYSAGHSLLAVGFAFGRVVMVGSNSDIVTSDVLPEEAPVIAKHSTDRVVADGAHTTLQVTVSSTLPVACQWFRDGTAIPGATSFLLALAEVHAADAGVYTVTVSNPAGSTISDPMRVDVESASEPASVWHTRRTEVEPEPLVRIAASPQVLVAITSQGDLRRSEDGVHWSAPLVSVPVPVTRVRFLGGGFVAVGPRGAILTSTDGSVWTKQRSGVSTDLWDVAVQDGRYVAVGAAGTILTSPNLIDWTLVQHGLATDLFGVSGGTNLLVAVGAQGTILTSSDGAAWVPQKSWTDHQFNCVAYGNGEFRCYGDYGTVLSSKNGRDWSVAADYTYFALVDTAFGNGRFCAVGPGNGLTFSEGRFLQVGGDGALAETTFGNEFNAAWRAPESQSTHQFQAVAYDGHRLVAVAKAGGIWQSDNTFTWSPVPSGMTNDFLAVTFAGNQFVASGRGVIATSPDGTKWTPRYTESTNDWQAIVYGNGKYVVISAADQIARSSDGVQWEIQRFQWARFVGVGFGAGRFVATSYSPAEPLLVSEDAVSWGSPGRELRPVGPLAYGNDRFVACGQLLCTSSDGLSWRSIEDETSSFDPTFSKYSYNILQPHVAFGGGTFAVVGPQGKIVTTKDGVYAFARASTARHDLRGVVYTENGFVAVGDYGTVLQSDPLIDMAPRVLLQPNSEAATPGGRTLLQVGAVGTSPMSYQWRLEGQPIPGATQPQFATSAGVSTGGMYDVVVSNRLGSTTSQAVRVESQSPPPQPHLELRRTDSGQLEFVWPSTLGQTIRLESADSISIPAVWQPIVVLSGTGGEVRWFDAPSQSTKFYQAVVVTE